MKEISKNISNQIKLKAVDFFCSGGGMSYGMQEAGIEILAGIDFDENCKSTYEANITGAEFTRIPNDLKAVTPEERATIEKMVDKLEEFEDVQTVYTNMIPEEDTEA